VAHTQDARWNWRLCVYVGEVTGRSARRIAGCVFLLVWYASSLRALDPHKLLTQTRAPFGTRNKVFRKTRFIGSRRPRALTFGLAQWKGWPASMATNSYSSVRNTPDCRKFDHGAGSHERRSLWVGTPNGLAQYREDRFRTFTTKDRLPDNAISAGSPDQGNTLWIAAGLHLSRYAAGTIALGGPCC
jgi:hypothetical protein